MTTSAYRAPASHPEKQRANVINALNAKHKHFFSCFGKNVRARARASQQGRAGYRARARNFLRVRILHNGRVSVLVPRSSFRALPVRENPRVVSSPEGVSLRFPGEEDPYVVKTRGSLDRFSAKRSVLGEALR